MPPTINTQPQDQTVRKGQDATFIVGASGTAPLRYYWSQGATVVAKGTNASFTS